MDKALKQRLVGASVLIILAVIVLPMLLSGRSDRLKQESRQIELPPKPEELSIETRRFPVGVPTGSTPAARQEEPGAGETGTEAPVASPSQDLETAVTGPEETTPQAGPDDAAAEALTTSPDEARATPDVAAESETPAVSVEKTPEVASIELPAAPDKSVDLPAAEKESENSPRYLVQVASFSNEKNANALADMLKKDKLPVLMDVVDRSAGRMYRVRVGPYARRADADALVSRLGSSMSDLTPRVLDLRPDDSAPVSTPSDPLVRWVVQVGSFSSPESAEDLVARLRLAGYSAFSEKVTSAQATVYKVRIGPELDRDKAADTARKVKSDQGLDAFVTTQE
jgi:DedD protein